MRVTQTSPLRRCCWLSKFHVERSNDGFWPFFGILGIFPFKDIESFIFNCIATNFICICLRINNKNLGTRPFKRCYWFTKFHEEPVFDHFWPVFEIFGAHFHSRTQILSFYCIATNFMCMCVRINCKNLGARPLKGCYWFSKFHVERFLSFCSLAFLDIFQSMDMEFFTFCCLATIFACICLRINKKILGLYLQGAIIAKKLSKRRTKTVENCSS